MLGGMEDKIRPIKKTVVLDPRLEFFVRKTWAILIESGVTEDTTYSSALNFMLVGLIVEAGKQGGLSAEAREAMWDFARDRKTVAQLNLRERLSHLEAGYHRPQHATRGRRRHSTAPIATAQESESASDG